MIRNRTEAGKKIARALSKYKGRDAIIYAIPRGGVIVGRVVADELHLPLDLVVTRKLVWSGNTNEAFGAVDEAGEQILDEEVVKTVDPSEAAEELMRQSAEVRRRADLYRAGKKPLSAENKICIVVDDGITTGYNIRPAVQFLKKQLPRKIVVAIPVAPRHSLESVRAMVDEIVTLIPPETFGMSVDEHYTEFTQPSDQDVIDNFLGNDKSIKSSAKQIHAPDGFFTP